jgi:hypothetical protein
MRKKRLWDQATMTANLDVLTAEWATALLLYPTYSALAREFVIDLEPCADLESGTEAPPRESVEHAARWLRGMDDRIQVHQLRQFLQTSPLVTPRVLETLLGHYLRKQEKSPSDRDKIDFLLVQFFSQAAPSRLEPHEVTEAYVARLLEPVIGQIEGARPAWLEPVEGVVQNANRARTLNELLHSGVLEQGRRLKVQSAENYFMPQAMVSFTRLSFLLRRRFFHLMHEDLNAILDGLKELESKGIHAIDCRRAQFSAEEPILRLRMICQSWKVMFQAEYSSGQPLRMLVDMRAAIDDALGRGAVTPPPPAPAKKVAAAAAPVKRTVPAPTAKPAASPAKPATPAVAKAGGAPSKAAPPSPKAVAAKAPAGKFAVPADDAPEFEVSGGSWTPDSGS